MRNDVVEHELGWTNQELALFHGTDLDSAKAIQRDGVLLARCRASREFGLGFYTTTSFPQAQERAEDKTSRRGLPAVLVWRLSRDALATLESLWFVRGAQDAQDFWSFVEYCRGGGEHHARLGCYDVVIGPVTRVGYREVFDGYDQISFHTEGALALLNAARPTVVTHG